MKRESENPRVGPSLALCLFLAAALALAALPPGPAHAASQDELRGVWVPTVLTLSYPSQPTADQAALKRDALAILDGAKDMGFNAVFFQVRPAADALYRSSLFPWSKYLTGVQGQAPSGGFDPLAFMVEAAHERGLQLHAWLNPYRITAEGADNAALADGHPARLHPEWTVLYSDGRLYWNPGEPGVQSLIADGVREIVEGYDVDGIHIDDYFYPGDDFGDAASYAAYGAAYASLADWRRANTETTVRNIHEVTRAAGKGLVFGVSPIGIWANRSNSALGSDTRGSEAYSQKFADTRGWVKRGIMDYVAPQIYWNIGYDIADYATLVDWWADVAEGTGVKLYIGQAAYRSGNSDPASPWHGVAEIRRQLELNRAKAGVSGYIMYSYGSFAGSPELYAMMREMNAAAPAGQEPLPAPTQSDPEPAPFSDMDGHWASEYVALMVGAGVIQGYPDGTFMPDSQIKRGDFVLMAAQAFGFAGAGGGVSESFIDVAPDAYYAKAIAEAKAGGAITGIGDNMFAPETPMTREDMLSMMWRFLVMTGREDARDYPLQPLEPFSDRGAVSGYAAQPMAFFVGRGMLNGDEGRLEPLRYATRAETAAMLSRVTEEFGIGKNGAEPYALDGRSRQP
ncbi:MAG: family 10 glycosylhydrolase [Clostridiales Family XIII bacterium]|jgi:uncharacterized lipoprotein YddW (UPF0748 family)|nr:family 10 glycosylhydrolase [Clostridiales Family XIII bacterium]